MSDTAILSILQTLALTAGPLLLGLGLWWSGRRWQLQRDGLRAVVEVVGYEGSRDADDAGDWHHPIVMHDGRKHVMSMGERRQRWPVGSMLPVRYRPGQIERMVADQFHSLFFIPLTIAFMGIGLIGMGLSAFML